MNKIRVIDLLNKIAKGEEVPKKIHFKYSTYQFDKIDKVYRNVNGNQQLEQDYMISNKLNDEIEIIEEVIEEEKEIEKLKIKDGKVIGKWENGSDYNYTLSAPQTVMINKINELIDVINDMRDKEC